MESTTPRASGTDELVLDRYRLSRRLGSGGMGTVWLAHDEKLERAVAVKRIGVEDPEVGKRAQREARAAARLSHPGIVALYESGQDEDAVYLVSELVRGRTLARLMADGLLSDRDVVATGLVLCDALAHAHQRGVVHRDVKPANVMVPDDGSPAKLTDFGIAQLLGDDALTRTGDVVGTLAYMAPEQAEGRPVTWSVDLYALGLVLYEALSGVNPVRGRTPAATIRRVGERLPELGRLRRDLPLGLCAAIDAAVAPHPEQRGKLADLKRALRAAKAEVDDEPGTIEAGPLEPFTRAGRLAQDVGVVEPATRARRLGRRGSAALGAAALAFGALALLGPPQPISPVVGAAVAGAAAFALPRAGWLALALALVGWLGVEAPGLALLVLVALAPVALLVRRAAPGWWSAPLGALLLGAAGLPGAWPALAGQARRWHQRAALGALGAWWLLLAEPLARRTLALGRRAGHPAACGLGGLREPGGPGRARAAALGGRPRPRRGLGPRRGAAALARPGPGRRRGTSSRPRRGPPGSPRGPARRASRWVPRPRTTSSAGPSRRRCSRSRPAPPRVRGDPTRDARRPGDVPRTMGGPGWRAPDTVMSVLRNLESKIAGLVEGTFGRVFKSEVRPVELARKLAREMDEHKTVSLKRTYVPNEYVIWLSPEDRERYAGMEDEVGDELAAHLLEHARREKYALVARPGIEWSTDERLGLGEFGIQARLVRPSADPGIVEQAQHGRTMVHSTAARVQEDIHQDKRARRGRAFVLAEGKRLPVPAAGAVVGRSRDCDVVLGDTNVSRHHAEIRPVATGWTVADLGSTNGIRVNGRRAAGAVPLASGDRLELGTVPMTFEVE